MQPHQTAPLDLRPLQRRLDGDVFSDEIQRRLLATDGSIFSLPPAGVVYPRHTGDVQETVRFAMARGLSVHPRGAGSGLCGGSLGPGLVVDFTRYMHRLLALDPAQQTFRCEPGYRLGELQARLKSEGLFFPPDPSSGEYATFGGMCGTNASGAHSVKYGNVADYLLDAEVVLGTGEAIRLSAVRQTPLPDLPPALQQLAALYTQNAARVEAAYPETPYNSAGYNLRGLVHEERLDLRRLLAGAEGTLGIVTQLEFGLRRRPPHDSLVVAYMDDVVASAEAALQILPLGPSGIEVMDKSLLRLAAANDPQLAEKLPLDIDNVLLIEFDGFDAAACRDKAQAVLDLLRQGGFTQRAYPALSPAEKERFWHVRQASVPILYKLKGRRKILALVEDAAVPIANLVAFFRGIYRVLESQGLEFIIVGHIAKGLLHVRPLLDLKDPADVARLRPLADDFYDMVQALGGTVSGEHGDGRLRSAYVQRRYPEIYELFGRVKALLDPHGILNPEIITRHDPDQMTRNLRYGGGYRARDQQAPQLQWPEGFVNEIEKCHGCSKCTTITSATRMCPIYKFTRDEAASPKAKANVLRALVSGQIADQALYSAAFQQVMRRCVNCGACRLECPSNVNIPQMALEARTRHAQRYGIPLGHRAAAEIERAARFSHRLAALLTPVQKLAITRRALEKGLGLSARRDPVAFSPRSLHQRLPRRAGRGVRRVIYFAGCYATYIRPEIGLAAVRLLTRLGLQVLLPPQHCCGLPLLSKGLAAQARDKVRANLAQWEAELAAAQAVVVTCSSCGLSLMEEWRYLLQGAGIDAVRKKTIHISRLLRDAAAVLSLDSTPLHLAYHYPCHLKVQPNPSSSVDLLGTLPGVRVTALQTHCCGMAGSWGLMADNHELSRTIGGDLMSQLAASGARYAVTDCPTCRMQMEQFGPLAVRHPVEILAERLAPK